MYRSFTPKVITDVVILISAMFVTIFYSLCFFFFVSSFLLSFLASLVLIEHFMISFYLLSESYS